VLHNGRPGVVVQMGHPEGSIIVRFDDDPDNLYHSDESNFGAFVGDDRK
jgi:hypothetical protein